jgi:hypothetical protein
MAPIKFEEKIKDKLEKRTLSPSVDGWSKLSDRLDVDGKKSKKPLFWWFSIAAGLLIMITVSVSFFNKGDSEQALPTLVEEDVLKQKKQENIKSIELSLEIDASKDYSNENESESASNKAQIIEFKKVTKKSPNTKTQLVKTKSQNANSKSLKKVEELKKELIVLPDELMIKNAVAEVLIEFKTENNSSVTDREIDSLLKLASKELFKDKLLKETSKTVDANTLLKSVEEDMGQSFRTKVFHALKGSYETIKTVVADRNN